MRFRYRPRIEQLEDRLVPSTFIVTDSLDSSQESSGTDNPADTNGLVSLRSAIAAANFDAAVGISDTINFDSSLAGTTIALTQGELELSGSGGTITIDGSALTTPVSISGGGISRVFMVDQDVQAAFDDFTITGGTDAGDGSDDYGGGGVENIGNLTADNVDFTANSATLDGGAISNFDSVSLTLTDCTFTGNSTAQFGGAIENYAPLTITNCSFTDNTALSEGGAIFNTGGPLAATGTSFTSNSAPFGGAVVNWSAQAEATMTGCTFENNSVYNSGGAIQDIYQAYLTVSSSTFSNNSAAFGGAIEVYEAAASLTNCTLSANSGSVSGGGIADYSSQVTADGCDFSSNTAPQGSDINLGSSGALSVTAGKESLPDGLFASSGRVSVTGPGTELTLGGASAVSGCSLTAESGATLNLPSLGILSSTTSVVSNGIGSSVDLPQLDSVTGQVTFASTDGGDIEMNVLASTVLLAQSFTPSGVADAVTLQVTDSDGDPIDFIGLKVSFALGSASGGQGTFSSVTDNGNGIYTATFTGTTEGTNTIVATIDGQAVTSSAPAITIVPGAADPANSVVTLSHSTIQLGGFTTIAIQTRDAAGNDETTGGLQVSLALIASAGASGTFGTIEDDQNGIYTATFTGTVDGTNSIVPTIEGTVLGSLATGISVTGNAVSTARSGLTLSYGSLLAGSSITVTLQAEDALGNQETAGGLAVAFNLSSTKGGQGKFSAVTDNGNGTYSATFTGSLAGSNTIIATIGGRTITTRRPSITVADGALSLAESVVTAPASVKSGSEITITFQPEDAGGNKLNSKNYAIDFTLGTGTGQGTFIGGTYNKNGTYTASFLGSTAGSNTIVASVDGYALTSPAPTISVAPGAASAATSTLSSSSGTVEAGNTIEVTLQAEDASGNLETTGGLKVAFELAYAGGARGTFGPVKDNKNGTYTATFTGTIVGSNAIAATIGGFTLAAGSEQAVTVTAGTMNLAKSLGKGATRA